MATQESLQTKLEEILGSRNVYYQPPESLKIKYPAIIYNREKIDIKRANNKIHIKNNRYALIHIDKKPDSPVIDRLLELPYCSHDRHYKSENMNHDALTLYW